MALTDQQIERVREIIGFTSFDATAALCSRLNAVQETETAGDITAWQLVRDKHTIIKGDGVEINKASNRLAIINRVRRRLGLSSVEDETMLELSNPGAVHYSHPSDESENCASYCGQRTPDC
jgi:uncharacterized protein YuzE